MTMTIPLTDEEVKTLGAKAIEAKESAYCPYSHFRVGACLLTACGEYITGANVENASYTPTSCAERTAFCTAVTSVKRPGMPDFKALAVASDISPGASPCGVCRQVINEFCPSSLPIYMYDKDGKYIMKTLGELLPMAFGPRSLPGK